MSTNEHTNRVRVLVAALTFGLVASIGVAFAPPAGAAAPKVVLTRAQAGAKNLINADRKANGRRVLVTNADAQAKAQAWANRLASENRLYHSRLADGIRGRWCFLGENVGFATNVRAVETAFLRSTRHRANILDPRFTAVGVGVATSAGGSTYVVQVFITPC